MKILLVEDDSEDAEFLRLSLAKHNQTVALTRCGLISEAVAKLENERFEVVLLDLNLPDCRGAECVERIQEADALTPIVVLSGRDDEDFAVEILNRGVQDYLVKWEGDGRITLRAIRYAVERKRAEIKLNYLARLDWLTTLPNRQYLQDELAHVAKRAERSRRTMALLLLDIDGFKAINETHGRAVADGLLRVVADRLKASVREGDSLARFGGDEFAIVLEDVEGPREVDALARKITEAFRGPFKVGDRQLAITASIGVTVCPTDGTDAIALLNNADVALRQAKQRGPNTIRFFTPSMHEEILSYYRLEADLKSAVKQGQFVLLYQPQLRLADHRVEAIEAKLHWNNAQRAPVTASELAVAEQTGCVIPMGMWVIEEVCRLLGQLGTAGVPLPRVGINVAAAQFRQVDFPAALRGVLDTHSIDPELIELEISEGALMENPEAARDRLYTLRDIGVRLAVDDFGAGKSCFSHLQQFPLDVLKVGSSFVTDLDKSKDVQIVCSAILSVARGFSLDVVADGVTSEQQEAFFARHDCLYGQGPYFSAPIEADQVGAKMAESGAKSARRRRVVKKRVGMRAG